MHLDKSSGSDWPESEFLLEVLAYSGSWGLNMVNFLIK